MISFNVRASSKMNLSMHHLMGAAYVTQKAKKIEIETQEDPFGESYNKLVWLVSSATLLTIAGFEAYINETFLMPANNFPEIEIEEGNEAFAKLERDRANAFEKYDMALTLKTKPPLPKGNSIYQNMDSLMVVRNGLTHFSPSWQDEPSRHRDIEVRFRGKFTPNKHWSGRLIFPNSFMTFAFSEWGIRACYDFIAKFCDESGIENRLKKFKEKIFPAIT